MFKFQKGIACAQTFDEIGFAIALPSLAPVAEAQGMPGMHWHTLRHERIYYYILYTYLYLYLCKRKKTYLNASRHHDSTKAHLRHRHPTRPMHEGARHSKEGARRPGPPGWVAAVPHEHVLRSLAAAHRLRIQSAACSPRLACLFPVGRLRRVSCSSRVGVGG